MSSGGSPLGELEAADGRGVRPALVVARFNGDVTRRLAEGARRALVECGVDPAAIEEIAVPGAWELPQAAQVLVRRGEHDLLVALGCVIRGETPHFEYVCAEASRGLGAVARSTSVPVAFGVLTTDTREQALARAGDGPDNKGYEAAVGALHMLGLFRSLGR